MSADGGDRSIHTVALIGNHLPRRCGIATFTSDLTDALSRVPDVDALVVAMNSPGEPHDYPPVVRFEISQGDLECYRRAADFLNSNRVDVVSLQHEYGIYGGKSGAHVIELMRSLRIPVVSTLHTVLEQPTAEQRAVLDALLGLSRRVVVMSQDGARLLTSVHGVPSEKIDVIPHGIPGRPQSATKELLGVEDRPVILTFGLLSPDKGVEYVIDAMPAVLARHPAAIYVVLGATHPQIRAAQGESYRQQLVSRAERLGVSAQVHFDNRFVTRDELMHYVGAADLYITPYLNEAQSTSGTLAYALGAGKAIISTPYRYARELLADGRGVLVPWRSSNAISEAIINLIEDRERREQLQRRAAAYGESMSWPLVARRYLDTFAHAVSDGARRRGLMTRRSPELPELNLAHLELLTDDTGLLQHATFDVPRVRDGYCLDDVARALALMTRVEEEGTQPAATTRLLTTRYLSFIDHALDGPSGRFRNFMGWDRRWVDEVGSDDSHARGVWALGTVAGRTADPSRRSLACRLFAKALPAIEGLNSPRAWAYGVLGLEEYLRTFTDDTESEAVMRRLAGRLVDRFADAAHTDWPWFEDTLSYCNARLPQALLVASARLGQPTLRETALRSLSWLMALQVSDDGVFSPIGTQGFFPRGGVRAQFDQQPVEACAAVSACLDAHRITGLTRWLGQARSAFRWFLGNNSLGVPVYDARTGGCRDGLHFDRLNENQGAESTLSFLSALVELRAVDRLTAAAPRSASELRLARS